MDSLQRLVIFDCDGVLVDSEVISSRIFTLPSICAALAWRESIQKRTSDEHSLARL